MPESLLITHTLGQPSQMAARLNNDVAGTSFVPVQGQTITIADETSSSSLLFGGTLTDVQLSFMETYTVQDPTPRLVSFWNVQATDWSWLMNKDNRVYARFDNVGANVAVARLLDLCDPALGMRVGMIPQGLGNVTRTFDGQMVTEGIGEIAKSANALWRMRLGARRIDLFQSEDLDGNPIVIDGTRRVWENFTLSTSLGQVRTRVQFEGEGSTTTAVVPAGANVIPISECGVFKASGGRAKSLHQANIFYAGRTASSGPGTLTGVTGVVDDIPQGTSINVFVERSDATAITNLATVLGGGYTGVVAYYGRDQRVSETTSTGVADQNLAFNKDPRQVASYGTEERFQWPGKLASVNYTTPATVNATLRLQSVTVMLRGVKDNSNLFRIYRKVAAEPGQRSGVIDLFAGA
jgi:hypothetical protein